MCRGALEMTKQPYIERVRCARHAGKEMPECAAKGIVNSNNLMASNVSWDPPRKPSGKLAAPVPERPRPAGAPGLFEPVKPLQGMI